jgi:hypothetical protein
MNKVLASVVFGAALAVSVGASLPSGVSASPAPRSSVADPGKCPPPSKAYKCKSSAVIATAGTFQVRLAGTRLTLKGFATRSSVGTQIYVAMATATHVPKHAVAFKLFATRKLPALTLTGKGSLYQLTVSSGRWTPIKAITRSGIYAAVLK